MAEVDLAKIVNLIMENPSLVEQIQGLVKGSEESEPKSEPIAEPVASVEPREKSPKRLHRTQLIGAMKPYLSPERRRAVETMMSIMDILDITGGRA